jgi:hypothetical protein
MKNIYYIEIMLFIISILVWSNAIGGLILIFAIIGLVTLEIDKKFNNEK